MSKLMPFSLNVCFFYLDLESDLNILYFSNIS